MVHAVTARPNGWRVARPRPVEVTIDGHRTEAEAGESLLHAAGRLGIRIPTMCHLDGLSADGSCRLCLVEVAGDERLRAACTLPVADGMEATTSSPALLAHRRMMTELLFAAGCHPCAVCVADGRCELQDLAVEVGMDHVRVDSRFSGDAVDASHARFLLDRSRCVLCTRCVRVCTEIEGAHVWEITGRGAVSSLVAEGGVPWGAATSCTSCGKCVAACPTGALVAKGYGVGERRADPHLIAALAAAREREWDDRQARP